MEEVYVSFADVLSKSFKYQALQVTQELIDYFWDNSKEEINTYRNFCGAEIEIIERVYNFFYNEVSFRKYKFDDNKDKYNKEEPTITSKMGKRKFKVGYWFVYDFEDDHAPSNPIRFVYSNLEFQLRFDIEDFNHVKICKK